MNAVINQALISKINALPLQQVAEVVDFVEFLATRQSKKAAFDSFLTLAPSMEAAGAPPMTDEEINAEVKAARAERRSKAVNPGATNQ